MTTRRARRTVRIGGGTFTLGAITLVVLVGLAIGGVVMLV